MTLKRTIKLLEEYLKMNNIIELTDAAEPSSLIFTIGTGISKSLLKVNKKRKKKHNKIIALAKNKLNTIDTLLSTALNESKISQKDFTNIIIEKNIYENIKENIKNMMEPTELPSLAELTAEPSSLERTRVCGDYTKSINPK